MKIIINDTPFINLDGENLKVQKDSGVQSEITLGFVLSAALTGGLPGDDQIPPSQKHNDYHLALKIKAAKESVELSAEEIAHIKDRVSKMYPTLVAGQAFDRLEGNAPQP